MKKCNTCENEKCLSEFHKSTTTKDGLQYKCKQCTSAWEKTRKRKRTSEYNHQRYVIERKLNPEKYIIHKAKARANKKGLVFDLTCDDIEIPSNCPILGIPLFYSEPKQGEYSGPQDNSPSLDRVNSSKGYTKDNIIVCSQRANRIKSNGSAEEHIKIARFLEQWEEQ